MINIFLGTYSKITVCTHVFFTIPLSFKSNIKNTRYLLIKAKRAKLTSILRLIVAAYDNNIDFTLKYTNTLYININDNVIYTCIYITLSIKRQICTKNIPGINLTNIRKWNLVCIHLERMPYMYLLFHFYILLHFCPHDNYIVCNQNLVNL